MQPFQTAAYPKTKYDYKGKYGIVNKYVSNKKQSIISNLTIRFETIKGYQSQVDWKEKLKLHDINGNEYIVSIFLIVLGNSRYKYIELTFDQTQPTLFRCLINSFKYSSLLIIFSHHIHYIII